MIVLPVAHAFDDYASKVAQRLHDTGFYAEANLSSETLNKRILEAQVAQWNYIVGASLTSPTLYFSVASLCAYDSGWTS